MKASNRGRALTVEFAAKTVLVAILVGAAVLKLLEPDASSYLGVSGSWLVALMELVLVVGVFRPRSEFACGVACVSLFVLGGALLLFGDYTRCGCLGGAVALDAVGHAVLTAIGGLASLTLIRCVSLRRIADRSA